MSGIRLSLETLVAAGEANLDGLQRLARFLHVRGDDSADVVALARRVDAKRRGARVRKAAKQ